MPLWVSVLSINDSVLGNRPRLCGWKMSVWLRKQISHFKQIEAWIALEECFCSPSKASGRRVVMAPFYMLVTWIEVPLWSFKTSASWMVAVIVFRVSSGLSWFYTVSESNFPFIRVFWIRSQMKQEDPLNLSILLRGGKETNKDSPSNGEWSGMKLNLGIESGSPRLELYPRDVLSACDLGTNLLKQGIIEGENPVHDREFAAYDVCFPSRVVWDCSSKRVVNFI